MQSKDDRDKREEERRGEWSDERVKTNREREREKKRTKARDREREEIG